MAKTTLYIASVVLAALLGWAVGSQGVSAKKDTKDDCHGQNEKKCEVNVTVGGNLCAISSAMCEIAVGTTALVVLRKTQGEVVEVSWKLVGGKHTFAANGIEILGAPADEFTQCGPTNNGRQFVCKNKHTAFGVYKYRINLNGGIPPLDPFMVNN